MRGRWAQGLEPRNLTWIVPDHLAISERPGGIARNHRKVRRQEELIWLLRNEFTCVVSLLDSSHNLHAYDEAGLPHVQIALGRREELAAHLGPIYDAISVRLRAPGARVLVHHEEFGDRIIGVMAGWLFYERRIASGTDAVVMLERITRRQLGPAGREIVAVSAAEGLRRPPAAPPLEGPGGAPTDAP